MKIQSRSQNRGWLATLFSPPLLDPPLKLLPLSSLKGQLPLFLDLSFDTTICYVQLSLEGIFLCSLQRRRSVLFSCLQRGLYLLVKKKEPKTYPNTFFYIWHLDNQCLIGKFCQSPFRRSLLLARDRVNTGGRASGSGLWHHLLLQNGVV